MRGEKPVVGATHSGENQQEIHSYSKSPKGYSFRKTADLSSRSMQHIPKTQPIQSDACTPQKPYQLQRLESSRPLLALCSLHQQK